MHYFYLELTSGYLMIIEVMYRQRQGIKTNLDFLRLNLFYMIGSRLEKESNLELSREHRGKL